MVLWWQEWFLGLISVFVYLSVCMSIVLFCLPQLLVVSAQHLRVLFCYGQHTYGYLKMTTACGIPTEVVRTPYHPR